MRLAVVSDLHLGILIGTDVAKRPPARERLAEALAGADHVVLLGDLLEMRERRLVDLLRLARPVFEAIGEATRGAQVTVVPGNHDHGLVAPWLDRMRMEGSPLEIEQRWEVSPADGPLGRLASYMPAASVTVAYPGLWLRPDVYATHGHYLDIPLTIPRIESVAASAMARITGRGREGWSAQEYEAALGPMYALLEGVAESAPGATLKRSGRVSRSVWERANGSGRVSSWMVTRAAIPGAVAALNRLGVGPLEPGITGEDLRRSGLAAMREVAGVLAPRAEHVIFGHTHRRGPAPGEDVAEWTVAGGPRLWNTGSWCYEPSFIGPPGDPGPYVPGTVIELDDDGPPRIQNVLEGLPLLRVEP